MENGTYRFSEAQVNANPRPAPLPTHRPGTRQDRSRIQGADREDQRPPGHSRPRKPGPPDHQGRVAPPIAEKHGTARLTQIVPDEGEISLEDMISNEGTIITITTRGSSNAPPSAPTAPAPGRQGRQGGSSPRRPDRRRGRRFRRTPLHRHHARLPDVLLADGPLLHRARVRDPEMGRAAKGRSIATSSNCAAKSRSPRRSASGQERRNRPRRDRQHLGQRPPYRLRHPLGHRQEIEPFRLPEHPQGRHHRHQD